MKPLHDTVKEIAREGGKDAGKGRHGPSVMAKLSEDDASLKAYAHWLKSQPVEMLRKTYYILMTGWSERRTGLADLTTLFRDAISIAESGGGTVGEVKSEQHPPSRLFPLPPSQRDNALIRDVLEEMGFSFVRWEEHGPNGLALVVPPLDHKLAELPHREHATVQLIGKHAGLTVRVVVVSPRTPGSKPRQEVADSTESEGSGSKGKKKRCCEDRKIVKLKSGGKRCKNCGKKWKPKK